MRTADIVLRGAVAAAGLQHLMAVAEESNRAGAQGHSNVPVSELRRSARQRQRQPQAQQLAAAAAGADAAAPGAMASPPIPSAQQLISEVAEAMSAQPPPRCHALVAQVVTKLVQLARGAAPGTERVTFLLQVWRQLAAKARPEFLTGGQRPRPLPE